MALEADVMLDVDDIEDVLLMELKDDEVEELDDVVGVWELDEEVDTVLLVLVVDLLSAIAPPTATIIIITTMTTMPIVLEMALTFFAKRVLEIKI